MSGSNDPFDEKDLVSSQGWRAVLLEIEALMLGIAMALGLIALLRELLD
ncbi:MAG: hypothetical protein KDA48_13145 [Amphiplicatus sp.]|nr:hypothetical protein [Amphiplicatus sp.]